MKILFVLSFYCFLINIYLLHFSLNLSLNFIKNDFSYYYVGFQKITLENLFNLKFINLINLFNDKRKYFLKKYIYTINHKRIAINYFFFSMWSGLSGAALATMIRLELAYPGSHFFKGDSIRYLQVITAHGLIMVFFVVVPIIFGGFANFLIPYHVGSKDVAFPRLNSMGFWLSPVAFILIAKTAFMRPQFWHYYEKIAFFYPLMEKDRRRFSNEIFNELLVNKTSNRKYDSQEQYWFWDARKKINIANYDVFSFIPIKALFWNSLFNNPESLWHIATRVTGKRRRKIYFTKCTNSTLTLAGWTFIPPFSSAIRFSGIGSMDAAIISVIFAGVTTTISFTNLLITRRTLAMPGLRNRKVLLPFISIALFLAMRMLALITPVLAAAMIMLLMDRHMQTTFFEYAYGGDSVLFQHLFWFFGHPEVYVLIIPAFGFANMIIPYSNTRRMASKHHLIWATYVMAYMGFLVWGHHMYLVGLDHRSRALFSTITVMISLPATVKIVNWTLTLINGAFKWEAPIIGILFFFMFFIAGGLTGMWLSHVGLNVSMHDTFYVVAHFHLMLAGAVLTASFSGFYYYFPALFGIKYSRIFAYLHLIYYFGGQWLTFMPLFWVGYAGLPRRVHDYPVVFMGWHGMSSAGHFVVLVSISFFFMALLDSHMERRIAVHNTLGLPRWHKRILYYIFKIRYLQLTNKKLSRLPNKNVRILLTKYNCNEYEIFL